MSGLHRLNSPAHIASSMLSLIQVLKRQPAGGSATVPSITSSKLVAHGRRNNGVGNYCLSSLADEVLVQCQFVLETESGEQDSKPR